MIDEAELDRIASRLEALRAQGGERFDPAACLGVRLLLDRAETMESERLLRRAESRLDALESALSTAREQTEAEAAALGERADGERELWRALARGDVGRARQRLRALRALPPRRTAEARRGAAEHYRRASAEFSASLTVARARAHLPPSAGPYNGTLVATRALDRLAERSPTYVHTLVERLEDLAALEAVARPAEGPTAPARRGRGGSSASRSGGASRSKSRGARARGGRSGAGSKSGRKRR